MKLFRLTFSTADGELEFNVVSTDLFAAINRAMHYQNKEVSGGHWIGAENVTSVLTENVILGEAK